MAWSFPPLDQQANMRFGRPQCDLRPLALAAALHVAQFAGDRRDQTGPFPFLDVVLGALPHQRDREVQIDCGLSRNCRDGSSV
jgi:hypothetical protein